MFVTSVFGRLSTLGSEQLSTLFSAVPPSPAVHRFKVLLCPKFLTDNANDSRSPDEERPKVQARAQPRAFRPMRDSSAPGDRTATLTSESSGPSQSSKNLLPEYNEIRRLMETKVSTSANLLTMSLLLKIKFELFNSYAALQSEIPRPERDPDWVDCLHTGNLNETLDLAFGGEPGRVYRKSLESIVYTYIATS